MKGEWRVSAGEMYDAAPNTVSCWRVYEIDEYALERRAVAVFFVKDDAWEVTRVHNEGLLVEAAA